MNGHLGPNVKEVVKVEFKHGNELVLIPHLQCCMAKNASDTNKNLNHVQIPFRKVNEGDEKSPIVSIIRPPMSIVVQ